MYSFNEFADLPYRRFTQPEIAAQGPIQPIYFRRKCYCRFLWNTELHGVTQYLRAKTLWSKIFWACVIVGFLTAATYTTINVFSNYLENQTSTLITIKQV
uniref:Uncharacterized protein n=1 Tax=Acrobeloides nanus TaxID=290746 RepID=A0A914E391_9BILA